MLSEAEITRFEDQGYLVLPDLIDAAQLRRMRDEIDEIGERMRRAVPPGVEVLWEAESAPPRIKQLLHLERVSREVSAFLASAGIVDRLEPLLGPDIDLYEVKFLAKSERVGTAVPWHQDFPYWRQRLREPLVVCCMVYLDDADRENGCLEIVPGSHRLGLLDHQVLAGDDFNRRLARPLESPPASIEASAGTGILFTPLSAHASSPNPSGRPRRAFTAVFTAAANGRTRGALRRGAPSAEVEQAFALERVPRFVGPGPHGGQCASHYRHRELWKHALAHVVDATLPWIQAGSADAGAFEWLAARKPVATPLFRLDPLGTSATERAGIEVHGSIPSALAAVALERGIGWLEIESGLYTTARRILEAFAGALRPGSVVMMDRFHGFEGWSRQAARALHEALRARELAVVTIARSDHGLALLIAARGGDRALAAAVEPSPAQGISFERSPASSDPPAPRAKPAIATRARRLARRFAREARRWLSRDYALFPELEIPRFEGDGDPGSGCVTHQRRAALWRYALGFIADPDLPWVEFGVGEGESLDWFAAHKPAGTALIGFDSFEGIPEPWLDLPAGQWRASPYVSHRPDVSIIPGKFVETLARSDVRAALGSRLGFVHVDCDLYSSTRAIFEAIGGLLAEGTIVVFDELYGYPGWRDHEARALFELLRSRGLHVEYLARADTQVAMRILAVRRAAPAVSVRPPSPAGLPTGIRLVREPRLASWLADKLR